MGKMLVELSWDDEELGPDWMDPDNLESMLYGNTWTSKDFMSYRVVEQTDRDEVLDCVSAERDYQDAKWGTEFDDLNSPNDWVPYIVRYAALACEFNMTKAQFQKAMVKVAALAVAAIETSERNDGCAPRHYDEEAVD